MRYQQIPFEKMTNITIITVVYNGVNYLEETIKSVIHHKDKYLTYLIIDGGSTDGTLDIIQSYNDKIDYWISQPDKGIYDAMNQGWTLANPESFILYLGAGDKLLSLPKQYDSDVIYGDVLIGEKKFSSSIGLILMLANSLHHQALMIRKSIFKKPPFDLNFPTYADFDVNQRIFKKNISANKDAFFLSYALPDGVSKELNIEEMSRVVLKNYGSFWSHVSKIYLTLLKGLKWAFRMRY